MDKLVLKNIYNSKGELILKKGVNIYKVQEIHRFLESLGAFEYHSDSPDIYIETFDKKEYQLGGYFKSYSEEARILFLKLDGATKIVNNVLYASDIEPMSKLMNTLSNHIHWLYSHSINVALISGLIGLNMNLDEIELKDLILGALLHDIGNIMLPRGIFEKEGPCDTDEYETIQKHPEIGYNLLNNSIVSEEVKKIILQHHERIDGTGYPNHIGGQEISLLAQIVGIADSIDSATSYRCYKERKSLEEAIEDLNNSQAYNTYLVEIAFKSLIE